MRARDAPRALPKVVDRFFLPRETTLNMFARVIFGPRRQQAAARSGRCLRFAAESARPYGLLTVRRWYSPQHVAIIALSRSMTHTLRAFDFFLPRSIATPLPAGHPTENASLSSDCSMLMTRFPTIANACSHGPSWLPTCRAEKPKRFGVPARQTAIRFPESRAKTSGNGKLEIVCFFPRKKM